MCIGSYADISVHAPTRGATSNSLSFSIFSVFQSTLPREERLLGLNFKEANSIFQSTLPREKRLLQQYLSHFQLLFQSTLPREERHNTTGWQGTGEIISIHAPTRGATAGTDVSDMLKEFQSTLPREERRSELSEHHLTRYFNPRSHERSDLKKSVDDGDMMSISIHAPTRGATPSEGACSSTICISIHAPTRGATINFYKCIIYLVNFNPRSHERSDFSTLPNPISSFISIHAPTRGATEI